MMKKLVFEVNMLNKSVIRRLKKLENNGYITKVVNINPYYEKLEETGVLDYDKYVRLTTHWKSLGKSYGMSNEKAPVDYTPYQNDVIVIKPGEVRTLTDKELWEMRTYAILQGYLEVKR